MTKVLRCNDLVPGCPFEARAATESEILAQASEHARNAHGLAEIPPAMLPQIKGAIEDEG